MVKASIIAWVTSEVDDITTVQALIKLLENVEAEAYAKAASIIVRILEELGYHEAAETVRTIAADWEGIARYAEEELIDLSAYSAAYVVGRSKERARVAARGTA